MENIKNFETRFRTSIWAFRTRSPRLWIALGVHDTPEPQEGSLVSFQCPLISSSLPWCSDAGNEIRFGIYLTKMPVK